MDIRTAKYYNELIAKFMGYECDFHPTHVDTQNNRIRTYLIDGVWIEPEYMLYHKSWDWQIPVWNAYKKQIKLLAPILSTEDMRSVSSLYGIHIVEYHKSIDAGDILSAYETLAKCIEYYNNIKLRTDDKKNK
jgi:hypothetical protein